MKKDGSFKVLGLNRKAVGAYISTKAVGSDAREDVTLEYKYKEGKVDGGKKNLFYCFNMSYLADKLYMSGALPVLSNAPIKRVLSWILARTGSVVFTYQLAIMPQALARWSNILTFYLFFV